MTKPGRNEPCPCGSEKKWKRCHGLQSPPSGARSIPFDPMAAMLEEWVRPRMDEMRRAAHRTWVLTLDEWVGAEENEQGHDTERLERLIELGWQACTRAIGTWDSRFALQAIRSLPPEVIDAAGELGSDPTRLSGVIRVATAAAADSGGARWARMSDGGENAIALTPTQLKRVSAQAPDVVGRCLGAAALMHEAQGWYRWAGKGRRIARMPDRIGTADPERVQRRGVELRADSAIEKAVDSYERRRDAMLEAKNDLVFTGTAGSERRMWSVMLRRAGAVATPVYVPALDITFPSPAWYPVPDFGLTELIERLRPLDDQLREQVGLSCDELLYGLTALGLVIERQTQCGYLREHGDALHLVSPAKRKPIAGAARHLVSVLLRGTLRVSVDSFRQSLQDELTELGWGDPPRLADDVLRVLTGAPERWGLPGPHLFYVLDPLTCVLDLSRWLDFKEACIAAASRAAGDEGNRRGKLFEEQARAHLVRELSLAEADIPWPPNRKVYAGKTDLGDVDFCFVRAEVLFHLDMKSWQRTSRYHEGHYDEIDNRQKTLVKDMTKVVRRGRALEQQLKAGGTKFEERLDLLVVAFPEYVAPDRTTLWHGEQPRVVTREEVVDLARVATG